MEDKRRSKECNKGRTEGYKALGKSMDDHNIYSIGAIHF